MIRQVNFGKVKVRHRTAVIPLREHISPTFPTCLNCKYSVERLNNVPVCKLFLVNFINEQETIYLATYACRANPDLCGIDGKYFKQK